MALRYPTTSKTLLDRIASGDEIGWSEFYEKYSPIVKAVARCKGLGDAADDLCQQVMLNFFRQSGKFRFDPGVARFRTYFGHIVNCRIADYYRKKREVPVAEVETLADGPDGELDAQTVDCEADRLFMAEWRKMVIREAEDELKTRVSAATFQAYQLYAVQHRPAEKVAAFLDCTVEQVYQARKRCFGIMKRILSKRNEQDPELQLELSGYGV